MACAKYNSTKKCGNLFVLVLLKLIAGQISASSIPPGISQEGPPPEQPPLVFPEDSIRYKIIPSNSSIVNVDNATDAEIYDMLHAPQFKGKLDLKNKLRDKYVSDQASVIQSNVTQVDIKKMVVETIMNPKLQAEIMQKIGADVERDSMEHHESSFQGRPGRWAALAVAVVIALAVCAYLAMVLWRRTMQQKYGSRQILVNEDDTTNHFKHSVL